jgi:hypothetical protein
MRKSSRSPARNEVEPALVFPVAKEKLPARAAPGASDLKSVIELGELYLSKLLLRPDFEETRLRAKSRVPFRLVE